MSVTSENENPLQTVLSQTGTSGSLETDPVSGQRRFVPTPQVKETIEAYISRHLEATVLYCEQNLHPKWRKRIDAYDGTTPEDKGKMITIPIAKRDMNQQWAWLSNALLAKDPVASVKPRSDKKFTVPRYDDEGNIAIEPAPQPAPMPMMGGMPPMGGGMPMGMGGMMPPQSPPMQPAFDELGCEDAAQEIEDRLKWELQRVQFEDLLDDEILPDVLSVGVAFIKQCYEIPSKTLYERTLAFDPATKKFVWGAKPKHVETGSPIFPRAVSPFNIFLPVGQLDLQESPLFFEKREIDQMDFTAAIENGEYDFCLPKNQSPDEALKDAVYETQDCQDEMSREAIRNDHCRKQEVYETYLRYPLRFKDDTTGQERTEIVDLCAVFHRKAKKLLRCYENDLPDKMRPYVACYMRQKPHEWDFYSTVDDVLAFQNLESQLFHLQVQNMVMSNVKVFLVRKNSPPDKWFIERNGRVKPGDRIPYEDPTDISAQPLGTPIGSMSAEISFLNNEAEKMSVVNQFDRGQVPNRTPGSTVEQVQGLAKMQPGQILRRLRRHINRSLMQFVQMLAHYAPEGTKVPVNGGTSKLVRFPLEQITPEDFDVHLTATAEDESNQAEFERDVMLSKQIAEENMAVLQLLGMLMNPQTPPPFQKFLMTLLIRAERILESQMVKGRKDAADWIITEKEVIAAMDWLTQMAAQTPPPQEPPQQEGAEPNAVPDAGTGGGVPPTANAPAPMAGMAQ